MLICDFNRFLWVQLQLETISRITPQSDGAIRDALEKLPKGLNETYENALKLADSKFDKIQRKMARRIFHWLACSKRPLRLPEINYAIRIEPNTTFLDEIYLATDDKDIVLLCSNLVRITSGYLEFFHLSVKDFLLHKLPENSAASKIFQNKFRAHKTIAITCLTYLGFESFQVCKSELLESLSKSEDISNSNERHGHNGLSKLLASSGTAAVSELDERYFLLQYASHYWAAHCLEVKNIKVFDQMKKFIQSKALITWIAVCSVYDSKEYVFPSAALQAILEATKYLENKDKSRQGISKCMAM
jgi:hypothetical protein